MVNVINGQLGTSNSVLATVLAQKADASKVPTAQAITEAARTEIKTQLNGLGADISSAINAGAHAAIAQALDDPNSLLAQELANKAVPGDIPTQREIQTVVNDMVADPSSALGSALRDAGHTDAEIIQLLQAEVNNNNNNNNNNN